MAVIVPLSLLLFSVATIVFFILYMFEYRDPAEKKLFYTFLVLLSITISIFVFAMMTSKDSLEDGNSFHVEYGVVVGVQEDSFDLKSDTGSSEYSYDLLGVQRNFDIGDIVAVTYAESYFSKHLKEVKVIQEAQ